MTVGENILFETQQCLHLSIERSQSSNQSEFQKHRTTRARKDQSDSKHQNTAIEYIQNDNIPTKKKAKNILWQSEEQNTNRIEERIHVYQILANKHENKSIKASCSSFVSTCSSLVQFHCDLSKIFFRAQLVPAYKKKGSIHLIKLSGTNGILIVSYRYHHYVDILCLDGGVAQ